MKEVYKYIFTSPIFWTWWIFFLIIFIADKLFGAKILGWFGEHWTKQELNTLPKDKYLILNDVFIKVNDTTHQIDHVVISKYGIFSVESKQYNGYITGNKYNKKWIRHVNNKEIYYTNPIRQNYGHVKALSELLNVDEKNIFNVVCIPSKNVKLNIQHDGELVRCNTLVDKILSYKIEIIENPQYIYEVIKKNNIDDKNERYNHIKNIKEKLIDDDSSKCPICGGILVERNGKHGSFIGCSSFPKCKYTKKKI